MAKRTIHMLIDDVDGSDADETVTFALDGGTYEIDLSKKNARRLREALAPYQEAGSRIGSHKRPAPGHTGRAVSSGGRAVPSAAALAAQKEQNKAIREWAQAAGIKISDRGRIPQDVVDRYDARDALAESAAQVHEEPATTGVGHAIADAVVEGVQRRTNLRRLRAASSMSAPLDGGDDDVASVGAAATAPPQVAVKKAAGGRGRA